MSSRWKKVWADFWSNKTRTILTILTIAVGVFAVGIVSNIGLLMDATWMQTSSRPIPPRRTFTPGR